MGYAGGQPDAASATGPRRQRLSGALGTAAAGGAGAGGVVQEAYVQGVSTRRVDQVVQTLGLTVISTSQVSRICQELDAEVERFRTGGLWQRHRGTASGNGIGYATTHDACGGG